MTARLLFVGEAPTPATISHPLHPDYCDSGRRLLEYTGWSREEFLRLSDRTNLIGHPLPLLRSGATIWDTGEARRSADRVCRPEHYHVVLLGRKVSAAFGAPTSQAFFQWCPRLTKEMTHFGKIAICPHPSGRNRWWNDAHNRDQARKFFNRLATDVWTPQSSPAISPSPHAGGGVRPTTGGLP